MKFNIINIKTEETYREYGNTWKQDEELTDAKLLELNVAGSPPLYRKKVVVTSEWKRNEASKMYSDFNGMEPLWMTDDSYRMQREIWHNKYDGWSVENIRIPHFATVSQSDPLFISYFPDEEKGMLGKRVKIAPGKYLKKYFSHIYSDREIEAYANQHKEKYSSVEILWANTPEEIANVYKMEHSGFSSCMQKQDDYFHIKRNPTFVYGAGDLSLAYVVKDGYLITRALVWRDKNLVGRVYGDSFILRAGLAKEGIETKSNNNEYDTFEGAKLLKNFRTWDNKKMAVAPYIDGNVRWLKDDGDYFIIDKTGRYHAEWTDGMARPRPFCERIQEYVSETVMVNIRDEDGTYHLAEWSRSTDRAYMITTSHSDFVNNNSRYYEANNPDLIKMVNQYGETRYFTKLYQANYPNKFWTSDISGKQYHIDWEEKYIVGGKNMTYLEREEHAFVSTFDSMYYLNSDKVKVEGAGYWSITQAREYAVQLVEGDDTLFKLKRGFMFLGGRVRKVSKNSKPKFAHIINDVGANHFAGQPGFQYIKQGDNGRSYYEVETTGRYLLELGHGRWETNEPISFFTPDELYTNDQQYA